LAGIQDFGLYFDPAEIERNGNVKQSAIFRQMRSGMTPLSRNKIGIHLLNSYTKLIRHFVRDSEWENWWRMTGISPINPASKSVISSPEKVSQKVARNERPLQGTLRRMGGVDEIRTREKATQQYDFLYLFIEPLPPLPGHCPKEILFLATIFQGSFSFPEC
jgi:hypothetical protein